MHNRKPRSLIHEYFFWGMAYILVVVVTSLIVSTILTDGAVDGVIRQDIGSLFSDVSRNLSLGENGIFLDENFEADYEGFFFSVSDQDGTLLLGEYPQGYSEEATGTEKARRIIRKLRIERETYFVRTGDLHFKQTDNEEEKWKLMVWIRKSQVENRYRKLHVFSLGIILFTAILYIGIMAGMSRRLSTAISRWMERIRNIGNHFGKDIESTEQPEPLFQEFEELYMANDRLVQRMNEVIEREKQFNNDISHELRTPLAVIRAQAQMIHDKKSDRDSILESMERILKQADRMQELLDSLLELAHLEDRKNLMESEDIELDEVIRLLSEEEIEEKNVRISLDLQPVKIFAQVDLIMILLRNLISNAVKYGISEKPVEIKLRESETEVSIRIRDYGCGISKQDQIRIYEPFFRGDHSRSTSGNGLGLTLVKKITDFYGGAIYLESEEKKGSTFTVILPKRSGTG